MPTEPQSKASSRYSAELKIAFALSPSGKATISSTPHHQGMSLARRMITPRSAEPMSNTRAPPIRTVWRERCPCTMLIAVTMAMIA